MRKIAPIATHILVRLVLSLFAVVIILTFTVDVIFCTQVLQP